MILFQNDWLKYPNAIVDYTTTNESFKRMVSLYRDMGVENCLWPLALLQPELQGIDPHAEDLDDETKVKIGLECRSNPWYFLREVVRIPPVAGPVPLQYKANRGNLALTWTFLNNIDSALIQPRQTGKSVSTDCVMVWVVYIGASNTLVSMITKDHDLRTKNIERLKRIRDLLPPYLINLTRQDSDNQVNLTCKELTNSYLTGVAQTSESAANNLGRGLTSPILHVDEGPFIKYISVTMAAALAAGTAAREEAARFNRPYGNIFTTTAGKKDDRDGRYMYDFIHGGATWNEIFLDAPDKDSLKLMVKRNMTGKKIIINITMSHRQLGKTDEWLYNAIVDANASGEEADRDFLNKWTSGTQGSPLSVELNSAIKDSEKDPVHNEISKDSYIIRWYKSEYELLSMVNTTPIILGVDTSDAIGRDSIALVFTNAINLEVLGGATINETNLIRFSKFLAEILIKYPNITLIIERKSSAQAIIDSLLIHLPKAGIDPFKRMYNVVFDKQGERPSDYVALQTPMSRRNQNFYDKWKRVIGFNTTGGSRDLLYSTVLQTAAKESAHLVNDRILSQEIRGLVVKNGRIDHNTSGHDDMVIAWLMTVWLLTHSKNLPDYGIDRNLVLKEVYGGNKVLSQEEVLEMEFKRRATEEIEEIYDELSKCTDEFLIAQYESRLYSLNAKIGEVELDGNSIDVLIEKAAESRNHARQKRSLAQRAVIGSRGYSRENITYM